MSERVKTIEKYYFDLKYNKSKQVSGLNTQRIIIIII